MAEAQRQERWQTEQERQQMAGRGEERAERRLKVPLIAPLSLLNMLCRIETTILLIAFIILLLVARDIPEIHRWLIARQSSYSIRWTEKHLQDLFKNDPPIGTSLKKISLAMISFNKITYLY